MDEDDGNILLWVALGLAAWFFLSRKFSPPAVAPPPAAAPAALPAPSPAAAPSAAASTPAATSDFMLDQDFGITDADSW